MKNILLSELKINKPLKKTKEMERGDFISHRYEYDGTKIKYMDWLIGRI